MRQTLEQADYHSDKTTHLSSTEIASILDQSKIRTSQLIHKDQSDVSFDEPNDKMLFALNATKSVAQELLRKLNQVQDELGGRLSENHLSIENQENLRAIEKSLHGMANI